MVATEIETLDAAVKPTALRLEERRVARYIASYERQRSRNQVTADDVPDLAALSRMAILSMGSRETSIQQLPGADDRNDEQTNAHGIELLPMAPTHVSTQLDILPPVCGRSPLSDKPVDLSLPSIAEILGGVSFLAESLSELILLAI